MSGLELVLLAMGMFGIVEVLKMIERPVQTGTGHQSAQRLPGASPKSSGIERLLFPNP